MSQKPDSAKPSSERRVKDIRPATRRQYSAEKQFRCSSLWLRGSPRDKIVSAMSNILRARFG